jgi:hypothetical protein
MSNGKGDTPRPISVDQETFASNWERAFGTRVPPIETKKSIIEEQKFDYLTELHSGMFYEWYPMLTGNWEQDKARWVLYRTMRKHVKNDDCKYSGLPSVSNYKND